MIKSKDKKILATFVAGLTVCSNLLPAIGSDYRDGNSHEYGGGLGVTTPSTGNTGSQGSGSSTGGSGSSSSTSSGGGNSGSSGTSSSASKPSGTSSGSNSGSGSSGSGGSTSSGNSSQGTNGDTESETNSSSGSESEASSNSGSSSGSSQSSEPNPAETARKNAERALILLSKKINSEMDDHSKSSLSEILEAYEKIKTSVSGLNLIEQGPVEKAKEKVFPSKTVGDPVMITDGKFYTGDIDISVNYGSSVFDVKRNYTSQEYPDGALGKNWHSSFDSRIIRGTSSKSYDYLKGKLAEYEKKYSSSRTTLISNGGDLKSVKEAGNIASQISRIKRRVEKLEELSKINSQQNIYSVHGYEDVSGKLNLDCLVFVEDDGSLFTFEYSDGKKNYQGVSANAENKIYIESEGDGFVVRYLDGRAKHFDKWGMPVKIEDRFSSSLEFKYSDVIENNVRRVISVEKNGTPVMDVKWKNNRISKITDIRKSISVSYAYDGNGSLVSFTDADGDAFAYDYDSGCDLIRMIKPDGTFIKIDYSISGEDRKKRVCEVTNEEGFSESFSINEKIGKTIYTDPDGNRYVYDFSDDKITNEESGEGYSVKRTYNEKGLVESLTDPYRKVSYSYDEYGNLACAKYSDGSSERWSYIQPYNLLSSYVDRDGIKTEFSYNENGGLEKIVRAGSVIQTYKRDAAGRVVSARGINKNETYVYDDNGLLISDSNGVYRYDSQDRIISYDTKDGYSWGFSYTDDNKIQTAVLPGNLYEKNEFNSRKDLVKKVQKDLINGHTKVFEYSYDSRHLLTSVKSASGINEEAAENNLHLSRTIEYYPSGKVKVMIDWNHGDAAELDAAGVKRTYTYKKDSISSIKVNFVDSSGKEFGKSYEKNYSVSYSNGKKIVTITDAAGHKTKVRMNEYGFNDEIEDSTGRSVSCEYSPAGVLKNETGAYGGRIDYGWDNANDRVKSISDSYSKIVDYIYDETGRLKSETFINGEKNEYEYLDVEGISTVTKKSASGTDLFSFDSMGVEVVRKNTDSRGNSVYEKNVSIDKRNNIIAQDIGGIHVESKMNAWGDLFEDSVSGAKYVYDEKGNCILIENGNLPVEISYNAYNKISSVKIGERFTKYSYDAGGNLLKVVDNIGTVSEYSYDESGNMISEKGRAKPETNYEYDAAGNLIRVIEAGQLVESYEYSKDFRKQKIIDAKGNVRINEYDAYGNLVSVTDRLGKKSSVAIDRKKGATVYTDFNGKKMTVKKSGRGNSREKLFADGSCEKISYDSMGSISRMENAYGTQIYGFDMAHNLSTVFDGEKKIDYSYDGFGRLVSMSADGRTSQYDYFGNGALKSISQGGFRRTFDYDDFGQLVSSCDSSSSKICYEYDEIGRPVLTYQKDRAGNIIFVEGTVYGNDGRIVCNFDKYGKFSTYEYDEHGRIARAGLPFVQPYLDEAKSELLECGKIPCESIVLEKSDVASDVKKKASELLAKIGLSTNLLDSVQDVWIETYSYDENGNRISKITPAGKMEYEYDAENRLTGILGPSPVSIRYDGNGNQLSRKSSLKKQDWKYSQNNRVVSSTGSDYATETYYSREYGYDCLGRKIFSKGSDGSFSHVLYDGFTFDKVCEWQDKRNSFDSSLNQGGEKSRIRFRDIDGKRSESARSRGISSASECNFDRYYLYGNGSLVAQFNDGYSYTKERAVSEDVFAFCTDVRGSIRAAVGEKGDFAYGVNYGLNGQPHFSTGRNLDEGFVSAGTASSFGADIAFSGKKFDSIDGTYNYGFRSYSPSLSIFTTEDPIRDGGNWYAYCNGDPINCVDLYGLKNIPADMVGLMDEYGNDVLLGNSATVKLHQQGCYVTVISGIINTVKSKTGDDRFTPLTVNSEKSNFTKTDQCVVTDFVCENYKIKYEQYINGYTYRQIADKINELDRSSTDYCLAVKFNITYKNSQRQDVHWVTTDRGTVNIDGGEYVKVIGTNSKYDNGNYREGWIDKDGVTYAPIEQLAGVRAFQNDESEKDVKKNK